MAVDQIAGPRLAKSVRSKALTDRPKQPGSDRSFIYSEQSVFRNISTCFPEQDYIIDHHPHDLLDIFGKNSDSGRTLGLQMEACIKNKKTGKVLNLEVKKQGERGNAEERAAKHHTAQFHRKIHEWYLQKTGIEMDYHPFLTIFCEDLAFRGRYTQKYSWFYEEHAYVLWPDYSDPQPLLTELNWWRKNRLEA